MRRLETICALNLLALGGAPAAAQPVCLPRPQVIEQLQSDFGERLLWQGRRTAEPGQAGPVLEIFVSPNGGSWTLVHSMPPSDRYPGGLSCFVAAGTAWQPALAAPSPDGRKS